VCVFFLIFVFDVVFFLSAFMWVWLVGVILFIECDTFVLGFFGVGCSW